MSEMPKSPDDREEMGELLQFRTEAVDEIPIETFLRTPTGQAQMEDLIHALETSSDLVRKLKSMLGREKEKNDPSHVVTLLLSDQGRKGLNNPSLAEPFWQNPAMNRTLGFIRRAQYEGADTMADLYGDLLTILANITRYEILEDTYDPEGYPWRSRTSMIYYYRIGKHTQYLPNKPDWSK